MLRAWLGEQSGFGLDEDAAADQVLKLGEDVLGVLGRVQGSAARPLARSSLHFE